MGNPVDTPNNLYKGRSLWIGHTFEVIPFSNNFIPFLEATYIPLLICKRCCGMDIYMLDDIKVRQHRGKSAKILLDPIYMNTDLAKTDNYWPIMII